jgi:hypothetical protein
MEIQVTASRGYFLTEGTTIKAYTDHRDRKVGFRGIIGNSYLKLDKNKKYLITKSEHGFSKYELELTLVEVA